jgi:IS1 family transposase
LQLQNLFVFGDIFSSFSSPATSNERQNLTLRMTQKRFARQTNGFSRSSLTTLLPSACT